MLQFNISYTQILLFRVSDIVFLQNVKYKMDKHGYTCRAILEFNNIYNQEQENNPVHHLKKLLEIGGFIRKLYLTAYNIYIFAHIIKFSIVYLFINTFVY